MEDITLGLVLDFGTTTSTVRVIKNGIVINPIHGDGRCLSIISVEANDLKPISNYSQVNKSKGVVLRNAKRLLGKTRKDLKEDMLREELYGAPVMFDEEDRPYFHCNIGKEKNPEYRDVYPEEVFGVILKHMKEQAELRTEKEMKYCCFTVPHFTTDRARRLMRQEARKLDLECSFMMKEPTAAGIPFLIPENDNDNKAVEVVKEGETVFIFDFGGGTLDITIMRREGNTYKVIGTGGDSHLGGNDIDDCLFNYIQIKYQEFAGQALFQGSEKQIARKKKKLLTLCRELKESLSLSESVDVSLDMMGIDDEDSNISVITREEFENSIISSVLNSCNRRWRLALRAARLRPENINHVMLVGGSSRIPAIKRLFSNLNIHVIDVPDPQDAVVAGAMQAVLKELVENNIQEIVEASIGCYEINFQGQKVFREHIPAGTQIDPRYPLKVHYTYDLEVTGNCSEIPIYRVVGHDEDGNESNYLHQEGIMRFNGDEDDIFDDVVRICLELTVERDGGIRYEVLDSNGEMIGESYLSLC